MATIQVGGASGGRKTVEADVALVPFIDLLLCCVMFLLVTAVWNQLGQISAKQQAHDTADTVAPPPTGEELVLRVQAEGGWELASSYGDRFEIPPGAADELAERLRERRRLSEAALRVVVAPEDGVPYEAVVTAMDAVTGAGFSDISVADGAVM